MKEHPLDLFIWIETGQICSRYEYHYYADDLDQNYRIVSWYDRNHPRYGE